jgi:hypothetical protein
MRGNLQGFESTGGVVQQIAQFSVLYCLPAQVPERMAHLDGQVGHGLKEALGGEGVLFFFVILKELFVVLGQLAHCTVGRVHDGEVNGPDAVEALPGFGEVGVEVGQQCAVEVKAVPR